MPGPAKRKNLKKLQRNYYETNKEKIKQKRIKKENLLKTNDVSEDNIEEIIDKDDEIILDSNDIADVPSSSLQF